MKWDKCSLYSLRLTIKISGSGKLFHTLVVEHTNEFSKVLVFIEGMEKRYKCPQVIVVNGTKFIDVSTYALIGFHV